MKSIKIVIKNYSKEQIEKMSMIEVANAVLTDEKKELNFLELFDKVAAYKQFSESEKGDLLARFYTDLNIDGRFTTLGSNLWGLKRWYPVDQTSEKALAESRKRSLEDEDELDPDDELVDEEYAELGEEKLYEEDEEQFEDEDRKSTRLNSSHVAISYAVFCLKKK